MHFPDIARRKDEIAGEIKAAREAVAAATEHFNKSCDARDSAHDAMGRQLERLHALLAERDTLADEAAKAIRAIGAEPEAPADADAPENWHAEGSEGPALPAAYDDDPPKTDAVSF